MEISVLQELIKKNIRGHKQLIKNAEIAERYYRNENDILYRMKKDSEVNPLRNADNRIPRNFHALLVNQKTAYMFTAPPLFDVGSEETNRQVAEVLGDGYAKNCQRLSVNASNAGVSWLHYWTGDDNSFQYGVVDTKQVLPIYSKDLNQKLKGLIRTYKDDDPETGKDIAIWEYWNDTECYTFKQSNSGTVNVNLAPHEIFSDGEEGNINVYRHNYGEVPFIPFYNNADQTNDLNNIKKYVDTYDKIFSDFVNDLEDIQEVLYVLVNYGGQKLDEFMRNIKKNKSIVIDSEDGGDVKTLTIDIPVEAKQVLLEITRRAIFEQGQGVDPNPEKFGNTSGEALKFLYSLLELKSGFAETEFKLGFGQLVRAICKHIGVDCEQIIQIWTRTAVTNDKELAEICSGSLGITSLRTILLNHPNVENVEEELKNIEKENADKDTKYSNYENAKQDKDKEDEEE